MHHFKDRLKKILGGSAPGYIYLVSHYAFGARSALPITLPIILLRGNTDIYL